MLTDEPAVACWEKLPDKFLLTLVIFDLEKEGG